MKGPLGYGRYNDDPKHIGCPRAQSDMTPCIARDGRVACADDGRCVGCNMDPSLLLRELVANVTEGQQAIIVGDALGVEDLAYMPCSACGKPCRETGHGVEMHSGCHIEAGLAVAYERGVLTMACAQCAKFVARVRVAP